MKKIKIYGERNTGTNYLYQILRLNLDVQVYSGIAPKIFQFLDFVFQTERSRNFYFEYTYEKTFGWKHQVIDSGMYEQLAASGVSTICLVKNPYSWLLSFYKSAHHYEKKRWENFSEFLVSELDTLRRDHIPEKKANAINLWNLKNRSYYDYCLRESNGILVKFEDLVISPHEVLLRITSVFDTLPKQQEFRNYLASTKSAAEQNHSTYKAYYLNEDWMKHLTSESLRIINQGIDWGLADSLGYKTIELP